VIDPSNRSIIERELLSEQDTVALGEWLAQRCPSGTVVYLQGELGVGKTTLVRGLLRGLGYRGAVKSPTFTLVEPYELAGRRVYHFDLYRLASPEELDYIGVRDYFDGEAMCLVEWPERGAGALGPADLAIILTYAGEHRRVRLEAKTRRGWQCLSLDEPDPPGQA
jgi:tRNA threonylcarbamoyladenosine biosynthesis protein TsaE